VSDAIKNTAAAKPKMLGERSFGLIFSVIFMVIASYPWLFGGAIRQWALIVAACFAVPALLFPIVLRPLNVAWLHFGQFMHKIINPILMGLVFFIAVVPTGLILKVLGKDPMRRKLNPNCSSYWIEREQGTIPKDSFKNQF